MTLRLRPLRAAYEQAFRAAQDELAMDGFTFGFIEPGWAFGAYLEQLGRLRLGCDVPEGFVASTFLVADVDGTIVGRASIRHELNEHLLVEGGHIGYAVRPAFRRRGYATEILRQSLVVVRALGVERVLVTCDDDNVGSATVIESCGGVLEDVVASGGRAVPIRRYWIA